MKRIAEFFYILFRTMFQIATWLVLAVAIVSSVVQILDIDLVMHIAKFDELLLAMVGIVNDVLETDVTPVVDSIKETVADIWSLGESSGMILIILSFVAMYGCRFLQDFLEKRKPVFLGIVELTAEIAAWALKCLVAYISVCFVCYGIYWLTTPDALVGFGEVKEVIDFLLSTAITPLTFAGCAAAVCLICTSVSHILTNK